jgi:hypothetical protein
MSTVNNTSVFFMAALVCLRVMSAAYGEEPKPAAVTVDHAVVQQAPKQHVEEVTSPIHTYKVVMGGTLDGFNTIDYFDTYGDHKRQESKFEPNEYLVLENIGRADVVNPRIVINGRRNWHSADSILAGILKPGMSDAEKAKAIYRFTSSTEVQCHDNDRRVGPPFPNDDSHPSQNTFQERANPVKAVNCYYDSGCSLSAANFVILCRHAGLVARAVWICPLEGPYKTHCVAEAWYDGGWHLYDPELRAFYLNTDNTTVASYKQLHDNPSLIARTHHCGFANKERLNWNSGYHEHYPPREMPVEQWLSTMNVTLRPGETFVWKWRHLNKFRNGDNHRNRGQTPRQLANGKMIYRPEFSGELFRRGIVAAGNLRQVTTADGRAKLQPVVAGSPGYVIYKVCCPYPIVGGLLGGKFVRKTRDDSCRIYLSLGKSDWVEVFSAEETGPMEVYRSIDTIINPSPSPACYEYYVKFELRAAATPSDACLLEAFLETDVQMAATSLPALSVGVNRVVYRDESDHGARVRIRHGWKESSADRPPLPPSSPVQPEDGARIALESLKVLGWQPANDPDARTIANYHVQVSPRRDMLHPVSPNFDRLTFSDAPRWSVPEGWLVEGRVYFWRVRARNTWGAWSDWSPVWSFTIGK